MHELHRLIPDLLNRFDFAKVHRVMVFLNWRWANTEVGYAVPTQTELESLGTELLYRAVHEYMRAGQPQTGMTVATGGFQAVVETFREGPPKLQLLFYVDEVSDHV